MIVKFFSSKKGGGIASINYLLDNRVNQGTARVLSGNESLTRDLINSMSQKHKACVGCLSFEERNLSEELKKELMQSFENMLLTDEMKGRYNILWVEHTDKGRLELNFIIPKIDLESKKALNPYFHMADSKRKDLWTDSVNLKHGFTNPKDPAKSQTLQGSKKQYELIKDYEALDRLLHDEVRQGNIKSRDEMISLLKQNYVEVNRQGKDYLSIKLPESKKAKRFKGGIYDEQFTSTRELKTILKRTTANAREFNTRDNRAELERIKQDLDKHIQAKARYYSERYTRQVVSNRQNTISIQMEQHSNEFFNWSANNDNFINDCMVAVDKALSNTNRLGNSREFEQTRCLDSDPIRQNRVDSRQEIQSNQDQMRETDDYTRNRTYSRSREIANRFRSCFNIARKNTEGQQRTIERIRELDKQISKLREFIQEQFREFADRVKQKAKQLIERRKEREKQRYRQRNRGFSR